MMIVVLSYSYRNVGRYSIPRVFSEYSKVYKHPTCLVSFYSAILADSHDVNIF